MPQEFFILEQERNNLWNLYHISFGEVIKTYQYIKREWIDAHCDQVTMPVYEV